MNHSTDEDELERLGAEPWMRQLLEVNPAFIAWGPHEDHMMFSEPLFFDSWKSFGPWQFSDTDVELVNFYFEIVRASQRCPKCGGSGRDNQAMRPLRCPCCRGYGEVFTAESASVNLVLWFLRPRKGGSRGVEVQMISQADLPAVFAYLREAAERNAQRFAKIPSV